ncbi:MAG TPA: sigma-70 family RNA polymerase sigma factor [Solirubrobacteraceae bacterium]|nr:sigma-70 family RNA polymerase sigma factor [Solirubrobacteraceae bacterium]
MSLEPRAVGVERFGPGRDQADPAVTSVVHGVADVDFEGWFRRQYPRVLAYVLRRLPDQSAAEDIAAETFMIAWQRRETIPADPLPWLFTIAGNQLHNEYRSARRRAELARRVAAEPAFEHAPVPAENQRILDALARLGERDREVLMLVTWDGLDRARAAAVLGCSEKTFAVRLHRARRRLILAVASPPSTSKENHSGDCI